MNEISFPGLGLQLHVDPVAFTILGRDIYWYGIIIAVGFLLAVLFCMHYAEEFGIKTDDFLDMLIFATPGAIIGARLYYVVFYLDLFRNADGSLNFAKMLRIHDGGMAVYGSILAAVLVAWIVMRVKKVPFLAMADLGALGLLIGQCVGRWGNFVNVEAFGGGTTLPWRMGIVQRIDGVLQHTEVHPTFLYESIWNLLGFLLLLFLLRKGLRRFDGMLFFTYIAWYGFGRGLIEGLRTDSLYFFATGMRVSQMVGFFSA
ncbi:MAG: Prolipoprotein diacylglyceryl transferase, partial [Evtepia sp.]|nr:Prolipoprotein diacylglyceryl transferase [Evtepia sp.]